MIIQCIYAVTKQVIFAIDKSELEEGVEKAAIVLERQLSYFADDEGFKGFLEYLGEGHAWRQIFQVIEDGFVEEGRPKEPFRLWQSEGLDDDFRDLVVGLTRIDPRKRLTAQEALEHRWFKDG